MQGHILIFLIYAQQLFNIQFPRSEEKANEWGKGISSLSALEVTVAEGKGAYIKGTKTWMSEWG